MTGGTFWLARGALAIGVLALAQLLFYYFARSTSPGRVNLSAYGASLDGRLRFIRSSWRGTQVALTQCILVVSCGIFALLTKSWPPLLLVPLLAMIPSAVLTRSKEKRIARVEEQVEPWLNAVANSLKASPSLGEALASSISLVPAPMSEEVGVVVKEYELGTPLDHALENFAVRMNSQTLTGTILALKIARNSGGNLPEMLENAASALRELARLEGVVRTKTAEGKAQTFVIGAIPVPMVGGLHAIDPHYFEPLFRSFLGQLLILGAVILWALAILSARKILAVDV